MADTPRFKSKKEMYEDMLVEPTRITSGHTTKPMQLADKMFAAPQEKKMAKGGVTRGDGCAKRGKTKGRMV
jgi:hypothetical protein